MKQASHYCHVEVAAAVRSEDYVSGFPMVFVCWTDTWQGSAKNTTIFRLFNNFLRIL